MSTATFRSAMARTSTSMAASRTAMRPRLHSRAAASAQTTFPRAIPPRCIPNGFVPFIDPYVQDRHGTAGVWWLWNGWRVDASQTLGYNRLMDTIRHTLNASIANLDLEHGGAGISPDHFGAGGFSFEQATTNLDFSRFFDSWLHGVNIAFGSEFRHENYKIYRRRTGFLHRCRWPRRRQCRQPGFPRLPAGRRDRQEPQQLGRIRRHRDQLDRSADDRPGRALRALQRFRFDRDRQARRRIPRQRPVPAARLGQHRLSRAVAAAALFLVDLHRFHQRRARRRRARAQWRRDRAARPAFRT